MMISLIAAMSENRVIGLEQQIPWHLPDDLRHFKQLTLDHPIVMGRKTWESLGKPLPRRYNIVMTRQRGYAAAGAVVVHDAESAMAAASNAEELFIIGGGDVYRHFLPRADRLYLTIVHTQAAGDTYFPEVEEGDWQVVESQEHPADERHRWPFTFKTLQRRRTSEPQPVER